MRDAANLVGSLLRLANDLLVSADVAAELAPQLNALAAAVNDVRVSLATARRNHAQPSFMLENRRDLDAARILARGGSYKDVARMLNVSISTAQARVKALYLKLGVHSKKELRRLIFAMDTLSDQPPEAEGL